MVSLVKCIVHFIFLFYFSINENNSPAKIRNIVYAVKIGTLETDIVCDSAKTAGYNIE